MDHIYAVINPSPKAEVVAKPPAGSSLLHDHSFARPASETETPQVPENARSARRSSRRSSGPDEDQHTSAKSLAKKQTTRAKSLTKAPPSQDNPSTAEQTSSAKSEKKGGRRSRRSLQQSTSLAVAEEAEEEDDDGEFIPVATMASAPNSPAGMRSLLAEHLLSARSIVQGERLVSQMDFDASNEEIATTQDENDSPGLASKEESGNGSCGMGSSSTQQHQEGLEEDGVISGLSEEGTEERGQFDKAQSQESPNNSITLPKMVSLLTGKSCPPLKKQKNANLSDQREDTKVDGAHVIPTSSNSDAGNGNPLGEKSDAGGKDTSLTAVAETSDQSRSRLNRNSKKRSERSSVSDSVPSTSESKKTELMETEENISVKNNSSDVTSAKDVDMVEGETQHRGDVEDSELAEPEKTKTSDRKQGSVASPAKWVSVDSSLSSVAAPGANSPHSFIGCSISESVKLRQLALLAAKDQNGVHETKDARLAGRKRSVGKARLDSTSSQSDVSQDVTVSPQTPSKSSLREVLTESTPAKSSLERMLTQVTPSETSSEEMPTKSTPSKLSSEEMPTKSTPNKTPSEEMPTKSTPSKLSSEEMPTKSTPNKTPSEEMPTKSTPSKFPSEEMLTKSTPNKSSSEEVSTKSTPTPGTPATPERKEIQSEPPAKKAKVFKTDPSDLPFDVGPYLLPLEEHGWKRELVFRGVFDELSKRKNPPADVYYFTPEGKKLRSRVMIGDYLKEHSTPGITMDNFTFYKKPISEEPFEMVRQAGKNSGRKPDKNSPKTFTPSPSPAQMPKINKVRIKIGAGLARRITIVPQPSTSGTLAGKSSRTVYKTYDTTSKSSFFHPDDLSDMEAQMDEDDEEYDPYDEDQKPKWNKTRSVFGKHRGRRQHEDREILIQSMPEPDIIIDRAEESPHFDEADLQEEEGDSFEESPGKPPRMMLLPGDIKEEQLSDEEGGEKDREDGSDIGTVHIHRSPPVKPIRYKSTARKSTTPRFVPKKTDYTYSNNKSKELALSDGQLCSNNCPGLDGVPPTLQCCVCMCLFHHQCVNVDPNKEIPWTLPTFKCLRCKSTPSTQRIDLPQSRSSSSPNTSTFILTSVSCVPTSISQSQGTRVLYVRTPLTSGQTSYATTSATMAPFRPPLLAVRQAPPATGPRMDSIQMLRNLAPTPITPPQLVRGIAAPLTLLSGKRLLPPLRPPRLTAAPGVAMSSVSHIPTTMSMTNSSSSLGLTQVSQAQPQPQIMTLPASLLSQLNLSQPLAVKLNNTQVVVPPSCIINSPDGLKVLLPPSTFPIPSDSNAKVSVTVSNNANNNTTASPVNSGTISAGKDGHQSTRPSSASSQDTISSRGSESSERVQTYKQRSRKSHVGIDFTQCRMHRLFGGFDCMLEIFRYLSVPDLLRAGLVCRTWHQISCQKQLWQRVDLKGLHITHWDKATECLRSCGTQILCLQNIHHNGSPKSNGDWMLSWGQLLNYLDILSGLRSVEFGLVPALVLHMVAEKLPDLEVLRAEHISDFCNEEKWTAKSKLDIGKLAGLRKLLELRLRGVSGLTLPPFTFSGTLSQLANLSRLHTLSLTSLCALRDSDYTFLSEMKQLEVLELGDCLYWTSETYKLLAELQNLRHLKLVCGGDIPDIGVGDAIAKLTMLERLELILFEIPASMESSLSRLPNLDTLVIWPHSNHGLMPALVNSHALTAVVGLTQLKSLTWGVVMHQNDADEASPDFSPLTTSSDTPNTIPLLKPGTTLDPDVEQDSSVEMNVSVTAFTEKLCTALPSSTIIKVFNTQVVGTEPSCLL
ncbi:mucin-4-like isoform X2 [Littorina saxatilis]|uniref:MBD domain-containing protein n=1 Tax=Littorina saxatilis TaxID=31220 RepID=A0AAN9GD95_9CAEN